jgi:hypothetical protein
MPRCVAWQSVFGRSGENAFQTPQGRLRRTLCLGLKHPRVGRPFRARRLMLLLPGLKHWLKHLGYSVRPLRGQMLRKAEQVAVKICDQFRLALSCSLLQPSYEQPKTPSTPDNASIGLMSQILRRANRTMLFEVRFLSEGRPLCRPILFTL